jgi:hypothetical protein
MQPSRRTIHYGIDELGIPFMRLPDCKSVYIVQDAYTRQFYPDSHEKFLAVATQYFNDEADAYAYTQNHGVIDMLTGIVALNYNETDLPTAERNQFDTLVGTEVARMITKGDSR